MLVLAGVKKSRNQCEEQEVLLLGRGPSFIYEAGKKISWRDVTSFWGLVLLERQSRGLVYNVGEKDESGGL